MASPLWGADQVSAWDVARLSHQQPALEPCGFKPTQRGGSSGSRSTSVQNLSAPFVPTPPPNRRAPSAPRPAQRSVRQAESASSRPQAGGYSTSLKTESKGHPYSIDSSQNLNIASIETLRDIIDILRAAVVEDELRRSNSSRSGILGKVTQQLWALEAREAESEASCAWLYTELADARSAVVNAHSKRTCLLQVEQSQSPMKGNSSYLRKEREIQQLQEDKNKLNETVEELRQRISELGTQSLADAADEAELANQLACSEELCEKLREELMSAQKDLVEKGDDHLAEMAQIQGAHRQNLQAQSSEVGALQAHLSNAKTVEAVEAAKQVAQRAELREAAFGAEAAAAKAKQAEAEAKEAAAAEAKECAIRWLQRSRKLKQRGVAKEKETVGVLAKHEEHVQAISEKHKRDLQTEYEICELLRKGLSDSEKSITRSQEAVAHEASKAEEAAVKGAETYSQLHAQLLKVEAREAALTEASTAESGVLQNRLAELEFQIDGKDKAIVAENEACDSLRHELRDAEAASRLALADDTSAADDQCTQIQAADVAGGFSETPQIIQSSKVESAAEMSCLSEKLSQAFSDLAAARKNQELREEEHKEAEAQVAKLKASAEEEKSAFEEKQRSLSQQLEEVQEKLAKAMQDHQDLQISTGEQKSELEDECRRLQMVAEEGSAHEERAASIARLEEVRQEEVCQEDARKTQAQLEKEARMRMTRARALQMGEKFSSAMEEGLLQMAIVAFFQNVVAEKYERAAAEAQVRHEEVCQEDARKTQAQLEKEARMRLTRTRALQMGEKLSSAMKESLLQMAIVVFFQNVAAEKEERAALKAQKSAREQASAEEALHRQELQNIAEEMASLKVARQELSDALQTKDQMNQDLSETITSLEILQKDGKSAEDEMKQEHDAALALLEASQQDLSQALAAKEKLVSEQHECFSSLRSEINTSDQPQLLTVASTGDRCGFTPGVVEESGLGVAPGRFMDQSCAEPTHKTFREIGAATSGVLESTGLGDEYEALRVETEVVKKALQDQEATNHIVTKALKDQETLVKDLQEQRDHLQESLSQALLIQKEKGQDLVVGNCSESMNIEPREILEPRPLGSRVQSGSEPAIEVMSGATAGTGNATSSTQSQLPSANDETLQKVEAETAALRVEAALLKDECQTPREQVSDASFQVLANVSDRRNDCGSAEIESSCSRDACVAAALRNGSQASASANSLELHLSPCDDVLGKTDRQQSITSLSQNKEMASLRDALEKKHRVCEAAEKEAQSLRNEFAEARASREEAAEQIVTLKTELEVSHKALADAEHGAETLCDELHRRRERTPEMQFAVSRRMGTPEMHSAAARSSGPELLEQELHRLRGELAEALQLQRSAKEAEAALDASLATLQNDAKTSAHLDHTVATPAAVTAARPIPAQPVKAAVATPAATDCTINIKLDATPVWEHDATDVATEAEVPQSSTSGPSSLNQRESMAGIESKALKAQLKAMEEEHKVAQEELHQECMQVRASEQSLLACHEELQSTCNELQAEVDARSKASAMYQFATGSVQATPVTISGVPHKGIASAEAGQDVHGDGREGLLALAKSRALALGTDMEKITSESTQKQQFLAKAQSRVLTLGQDLDKLIEESTLDVHSRQQLQNVNIPEKIECARDDEELAYDNKLATEAKQIRQQQESLWSQLVETLQILSDYQEVFLKSALDNTVQPTRADQVFLQVHIKALQLERDGFEVAVLATQAAQELWEQLDADGVPDA